MLLQDNLERALRRIAAVVIESDAHAILAECDSAEQRYGHHFLYEFGRYHAYFLRGEYTKARGAIQKVELHRSQCDSPLCPSCLTPFMHAQLSIEENSFVEALKFINQYLSNDHTIDDIIGLVLKHDILLEQSKEEIEETR